MPAFHGAFDECSFHASPLGPVALPSQNPRRKTMVGELHRRASIPGSPRVPRGGSGGLAGTNFIPELRQCSPTLTRSVLPPCSGWSTRPGCPVRGSPGRKNERAFFRTSLSMELKIPDVSGGATADGTRAECSTRNFTSRLEPWSWPLPPGPPTFCCRSQ